MAFAFEKRIVYQESIYFADQVLFATERFPRRYAFLSDARWGGLAHRTTTASLPS